MLSYSNMHFSDNSLVGFYSAGLFFWSYHSSGYVSQNRTCGDNSVSNELFTALSDDGD